MKTVNLVPGWYQRQQRRRKNLRVHVGLMVLLGASIFGAHQLGNRQIRGLVAECNALKNTLDHTPSQEAELRRQQAELKRLEDLRLARRELGNTVPMSAVIQQLQNDMTRLMSAALEASSKVMSDDANEGLVMSGERNLLQIDDLSTNVASLRKLFEAFERRSSLMQLLDTSRRAAGVHLFIGGESGFLPLDECSLVTAPYEVDGQVVGTLGVIGPTRMAYERVIPIVDVTARLLSSALSTH